MKIHSPSLTAKMNLKTSDKARTDNFSDGKKSLKVKNLIEKRFFLRPSSVTREKGRKLSLNTVAVWEIT